MKTLFAAVIVLTFASPTFADETPRAAKTPARVVALSPALTELVYALGLQKKLVGVSDYSDYPKAAKKLPSVGPYTKPNREKILELKPDLVLVPQEGPEDTRHSLEMIKANYIIISMRTLDQIGEAAQTVATLLGEPKKGSAFKDKWDSDLKRAFDGVKPKHQRTLIEIQNTPLIAAGRGTFLDEVVTRCGADNVIQAEGYPRVSVESMAIQKLDVIFLADHFAKAAEKNAAEKSWRRFPSMKKTKIIPLDPDTTSRPGPRLLTGIKKVCSDLQKNPAP
jgi:iron complex transport system substrate-binding protein